MSLDEPNSIQISPEQAGIRLDKVLAEMFPEYSRNCLQAWLKAGHISINGEPGQPKQKVLGNEIVRLDIPLQARSEDIEPQAIDLNVIYVDAELIVINKPAGLVVHPAAGNPDGTLQNGLLHHFPELTDIPRSGIVHRLDKDTSGLLVVARSLKAHKSLVDQLQKRTVSREYIAVIQGKLVAGGTIDEPIGRHPQDRKRMCVRSGGRKAITHYRIEERFCSHTQLRVMLETGRTHQIRVHLAHIRKPIVGDQTYGGRFRLPAQCKQILQLALIGFKRQALHAAQLGLLHPESGQALRWQAPLPDDLQNLIYALREDAQENLNA